MKARTKLIDCFECDGYGTVSADLDQPAITPCSACNGSGEVRQLMTEEEIAQAKHDRDEADRESWMHDAYDRAGDR